MSTLEETMTHPDVILKNEDSMVQTCRNINVHVVHIYIYIYIITQIYVETYLNAYGLHDCTNQYVH